MAIYEQIEPPLYNEFIEADMLKNALKISTVTAKILINRGICKLEEAKRFLNPSLDNLFDPFILKDMDKAVKRINKAILSKEQITIYGDYDVDGMTSCSLLYRFFKDMGCSPNVYIPNRIDEGYGINSNAIDSIHSDGTKLLISVDCGITSINEIDQANRLGMDVIVTDHHECGSCLPEAIAVINPTRDHELHIRHPLAGVGVAGKLVQAIGGESYLEKYLDLIALGTVADVVPLIGDNRILVAKGLEKLNKSPCVGIKALIKESGMEDRQINAGRIAFGLAPRLNAAGRVDNPMKGYELLTTNTLSIATPIAQLLEDKNRYRQRVEEDIIKEAQEMIEKYVDLSKERIIVLEKEDWNPGIIGIAASKISEKYLRPCLLISISGAKGVGSARSIKDFNIYNALSTCSHLFEKFGGHEQAAGFSLLKENIKILKQELIEYCQKNIIDSMLIPRYTYDVDLKSGDISYELAGQLEALEPFGIGNPSPHFLLSQCKIEENRLVGSDNKHLKMSISLGQRQWDGIAFGMGERADSFDVAKEVSIITTLEKNQWRGISKLQFNIKHLDPILEDHDDMKEFLKFFYLKYFNVFFSNFMYNKHYSKNIYLSKPNNISKIDIQEAMLNLEETRMGNLILINSLYNSKNVFKDIFEKDLTERVIFSYGKSNSWNGFGVNSCILAPDFNRISFSNYKKVFVFEDELAFFDIDLGDNLGDKLWVIGYKEKYSDRQSYFTEEFFVEREDFTSIYKKILSPSSSRNIWKGWLDLIDDCQNTLGRKINGFKIRLILKVFEELDFIKVQSSNRFIKIQRSINPKYRELDESLLLRYYNYWYKGLTKEDNFEEAVE